jgi:hypothetical protein
MADVADVEEALKDLISTTIYPNGIASPSAVTAPVRVYRGWPNASALNTDLAAGTMNITVFAEAGGRNTTRYPLNWLHTTTAPLTITATVSGDVVTIGGTVGAGQLVGIRTNAGAWAYATLANDTPATVAEALGALVPGATLNGSSITIAAPVGLLARVASTGSAIKEVRRQVQSFRISFWCPTPALRDASVKLVDAALANTTWLTLADGTGGRLIYRWSFTNDVVTKDALWRRDLRYDVEYPTTVAQEFAQMLFGGGQNSTGAGPDELNNFGDIQPATSVQTDQDGNILIDGAGNLIGVAPS